MSIQSKLFEKSVEKEVEPEVSVIKNSYLTPEGLIKEIIIKKRFLVKRN